MKNTKEHNRKISEGYKALHLKRTPEHKEAIRQAQILRWKKWRKAKKAEESTN